MKKIIQNPAAFRLPVPLRARLDGEYLVFDDREDPKEEPKYVETTGSELLTEFAAIENQGGVLNFARRFGVLGLCGLGHLSCLEEDHLLFPLAERPRPGKRGRWRGELVNEWITLALKTAAIDRIARSIRSKPDSKLALDSNGKQQRYGGLNDWAKLRFPISANDPDRLQFPLDGAALRRLWPMMHADSKRFNSLIAAGDEARFAMLDSDGDEVRLKSIIRMRENARMGQSKEECLKSLILEREIRRSPPGQEARLKYLHLERDILNAQNDESPDAEERLKFLISERDRERSEPSVEMLIKRARQSLQRDDKELLERANHRSHTKRPWECQACATSQLEIKINDWLRLGSVMPELRWLESGWSFTNTVTLTPFPLFGHLALALATRIPWGLDNRPICFFCKKPYPAGKLPSKGQINKCKKKECLQEYWRYMKRPKKDTQ